MDHTIDGSCETGRTDEVQVQQLGIGGDFHWDNVRGRVLTQFGMYSQMTPRNDPSTNRGQWNSAAAYQYVSEAYGGYHFDVMNGINLDAGIFMSYVGLFSYYNFDNWAYQPSYVSANTPWFFNGVRLQMFPSDKYYFVGFMLYNRWWFCHDKYAITVGGGAINNPGRYLVLMPPINGATAGSGTPYFTENPGDQFRAWDYTVTYDYMPNPWATFRTEFNRRVANVPYFVGPGGITPPGGNQGAPGSPVANWSPDLTKSESRINLALMVKF